MKNAVLFCSILLLCFGGYAQNVGIGNPTPAEKLDVAGNINVTGTIKANGVDGAAGQVLMKSNTGAFSWGDVAQYKNVAGFSTGSSAFSNATFTWIVPAGVTKIFVEAWGGGGGGASGGGGGGGGYAASQWTVTPGASVGIIVGAAGTSAASASVDGGDGNNSTVTINSLQLIAQGGEGGSTGGGGFPGRFSINSTTLFFYGESGCPGESNTDTYGQYSSTIFYTSTRYGSGGAGGNTNYQQKNGGMLTFNTATSAYLRGYSSQRGTEPSGGGGGGINLINYGASGRVIIHY